MRNIARISLGALALAIAVAAAVPSDALARSRHHAAQASTQDTQGRNARAYSPGASDAFGSVSGGSSSSSFGYGVGDNSHGCSACVN